MLSCRDLSHHASDFVEKQMSLKGKLSYGAHLLLCGHCRLFLRHFRTTIAVSRAVQIEEELNEQELAHILDKTLGGEDKTVQAPANE